MNSHGEAHPWAVVFSKQATRDSLLLARAGLKAKAAQLLEILAEDPFRTPPRYEKLVGNLNGLYSRRINIKHRLVYEVDVEKRRVRVIRMWTHYEF